MHGCLPLGLFAGLTAYIWFHSNILSKNYITSCCSIALIRITTGMVIHEKTEYSQERSRNNEFVLKLLVLKMAIWRLGGLAKAIAESDRLENHEDVTTRHKKIQSVLIRRGETSWFSCKGYIERQRKVTALLLTKVSAPDTYVKKYPNTAIDWSYDKIEAIIPEVKQILDIVLSAYRASLANVLRNRILTLTLLDKRLKFWKISNSRVQYCLCSSTWEIQLAEK